MPDPISYDIKQEIIKTAQVLGFDVVGVSSVEPDRRERERLFDWLARGYHASMSWMERDPERRADVQKTLPGARSLISLAINYFSPRPQDDSCGCLKVSRYAWGEDYHEVVGGKIRQLDARLRELVPDSQSVTCVDTAPIMEKSWAQRAGVGWIGRNANLITRDLGSWVFLAEIVTTAELPADEPHADFCGTCTRCIDACPTEAIVEPYVVDSNRCIAYWTIEHRGDFPENLAENFDGWIFGCDICQEVCPWNRFAMPAREASFEARCDCVCPPGDRWQAMDDKEFATTFADSAIRRTKREGLARNIRTQNGNALRAILNSVTWEPPDDLDHITIDGLDTSDSSLPPKSS